MSTSSSVVGGQIEALATELRLPTVRSIYRKLAHEVTAQGGDYEAYLLALLRQEAEDRTTRRVQRRIKQARFPQLKLLGEIDFSAEAMVPKAQLMALADGHFVDEGRNIIALGNSGTGKTHVATGLGLACCQRGLRVRFYTAATLAAELQAAQDEHQLHRYLARFARWDLVILDEVGYLPLGRSGAELLFQALSARHESASTVVTSNLAFGDWIEVFHTERLTVALLDRVTDRAIILELNGPSYRLTRSLAATTEHRDQQTVDA
jgi:DNA replication protein DnaC